MDICHYPTFRKARVENHGFKDQIEGNECKRNSILGYSGSSFKTIF